MRAGLHQPADADAGRVALERAAVTILSSTPNPPRANEQFVPVDGCFVLEHAGRVVRLWCDVCDKHQLLSDDSAGTVNAAGQAHRCGPRTSPWDRGGEP